MKRSARDYDGGDLASSLRKKLKIETHREEPEESTTRTTETITREKSWEDNVEPAAETPQVPSTDSDEEIMPELAAEIFALSSQKRQSGAAEIRADTPYGSATGDDADEAFIDAFADETVALLSERAFIDAFDDETVAFLSERAFIDGFADEIVALLSERAFIDAFVDETVAFLSERQSGEEHDISPEEIRADTPHGSAAGDDANEEVFV